jgi:hypothetical protein
MILKKSTLFLLLCLLTLSCATPNSVKKLSTEIVDANVKYHQSLKDYFSIIEKFVDAQIKVAEFLIKESDEKIETLLKKKAKIQLAQDNADVDAILDGLIKELSENAANNQDDKSKLTQLSFQLKSKHKELLNIQEHIIMAQKKLDEYIQLEKADEMLVNEFLGIVGIQKDKLVNTIDDITKIYTQIEGLTNK